MTVASLPTESLGATIRTEIRVDVSPDAAWAAVRDIGAVHTRIARGFAVDSILEGSVRTVTFVDGVLPKVVKEQIVAVDDESRRLAYGAIESRATFHSASLQVVPDGSGCRLIWITDILPEGFKDVIRRNMELGMAAMKRTLEEDAGKAGAAR